MRSFFFCLTLLLGAVATAQSTSPKADPSAARRSQLVRADEVMASTTAAQSPAYQRRLWQEETATSTVNAAAWLNRYLWTSRDKTLAAEARQQELTAIIASAKQAVVASAEYHLLQYLHSARKDTAALNTAFAKAANKQSIYPYLVQQAIITQNNALLRRYATELHAIDPLPGLLIEYHQNVLASADSGGTIYAAGINDLVPLAMVQQVRGFRKDVKLKFYDGSKMTEPDAYLCLSLGKEVLAQFPQAGYTGLLIKPSGATITELRLHLQQFDLAILMSENAMPGGTLPAIYRNYLPPLLLLYRQLRSTNAKEAEAWRFQLERLAQQTGDWEALQKQLAD